MSELEPTLGRRIGRQVLTVVLAVITLAFGAALTWASLASPRSDVPQLPDEVDPVNDLPANLTWLLLIGIAIVAWRQLGVGLVTAVACAGMVLLIAVQETSRYSDIGRGATTQLLIYLIAAIQAGSFLAVGIGTGVFGWHQRRQLRAARQR